MGYPVLPALTHPQRLESRELRQRGVPLCPPYTADPSGPLCPIGGKQKTDGRNEQ